MEKLSQGGANIDSLLIPGTAKTSLKNPKTPKPQNPCLCNLVNIIRYKLNKSYNIYLYCG